MPVEWELICHHTYGGIPGVITDLSPQGASHARAINFEASDYFVDGAEPASGAVNFDHPNNNSLQIAATAPQWQKLSGLKVEMIVRRRTAHLNTLIFSNSFSFQVELDALVASFDTGARIHAFQDSIQGMPFVMPNDEWVVLGFTHDGLRTLELSANDTTIARVLGSFDMISQIDEAGIRVGNDASGDWPLLGQIDSLKAWRLNPRRMYDAFHSRVMGPKTAECWRNFEDSIQASLRRHPECADRLSGEVRSAILDLVRAALAADPDTLECIRSAADRYAALWRSGNIAGQEMTDVFSDAMRCLKSAGLAIDENPAFSELLNSPCFQTLLSEITPPECDPKYVRMVEAASGMLRKNEN